MTWHEILNILLFNIKTLIKFSLLVTIIIFLFLFFIYPISYKATASILPPEKTPSVNGLNSLLSGQEFSSFLSGGLSNVNSQLYAEILRSRSASLYVVKKLGLNNYFNEENDYKAAEKLNDNLYIDITKEGVIKINVEIKTNFVPFIFDDLAQKKILAAKISNMYIEALDKINREKLSSKAKKSRIYIESQLDSTKIKMESVENALMEFQKKNKTISLSDQLKASIESASNLRTEMVKSEMELGLLSPDYNSDDKTLVTLRKKLGQLREQYSKLELGNDDYSIAFKNVPELSRRLAQLLRDVKIQNEVYLILQQQYYQEKIQENKDVPTVDVLDEAIPPLRASGPRVLFASFFGGIATFILYSVVFLVKEKKIR